MSINHKYWAVACLASVIVFVSAGLDISSSEAIASDDKDAYEILGK